MQYVTGNMVVGVTGVDQEFEKLMRVIFGSDFIDLLKSKKPAGWVDFMVAFEARKRAASPFKPTPLNISLPFIFIDFYKKLKVSLYDQGQVSEHCSLQ
jgi:hypothetical protein